MYLRCERIGNRLASSPGFPAFSAPTRKKPFFRLAAEKAGKLEKPFFRVAVEKAGKPGDEASDRPYYILSQKLNLLLYTPFLRNLGTSSIG